MKILVERGTHLLVVVAVNFLPTSISIFFLEYLLKDSQKMKLYPIFYFFLWNDMSWSYPVWLLFSGVELNFKKRGSPKQTLSSILLVKMEFHIASREGVSHISSFYELDVHRDKFQYVCSYFNLYIV